MLEIVLNENTKYRVRDFSISFNYEKETNTLIQNLQFFLRDNKELKNNMSAELLEVLQNDIPLYANGVEYLHFRNYEFNDLTYFESETDETNTTLSLRKEEHFNSIEE